MYASGGITGLMDDAAWALDVARGNIELTAGDGSRHIKGMVERFAPTNMPLFANNVPMEAIGSAVGITADGASLVTRRILRSEEFAPDIAQDIGSIVAGSVHVAPFFIPFGGGAQGFLAGEARAIRALGASTRAAPEAMLWDISTYRAVGSVAESAGLDTAVIRAPLPKPGSKVIQYDYTPEHARLSLRMHPTKYGQPKGIDTSGFKNPKAFTREGAPRDRFQFWNAWVESFPETLSSSNIKLVTKGRSPIVDAEWVKYFPEHHLSLGKIIEHHHLDHGKIAYPLPIDVHRYGDAFKVWHK